MEAARVPQPPPVPQLHRRFSSRPPQSCPRRKKPRSLRASAGQPPQEPKNRTSSFLPQEDVEYVWRLAVGSVAGGAAVKYGGALFMESTRPTLAHALLIIVLPMLISVLILLKESSK